MHKQALITLLPMHPFQSLPLCVFTQRMFFPICTHMRPQILYGQSIGGAVSIDLASRNPLAVCLAPHTSHTNSLIIGHTDSRTHLGEYVPLNAATRAKCTPCIRPLLIPLPPEVGLRQQDRTHPSPDSHIDVERTTGRSRA